MVFEKDKREGPKNIQGKETVKLMTKELYDFIVDLLKSMGISLRIITCPCEDWSWLDHGLRTDILGITINYSQRMNQQVLSFEEATIYHFSDIFQCCYTCAKLPDEDRYLFIGPILFERINDQRFDDLFKKLELPEALRLPLQNYYYGVAFYPYQAQFENLILLAADRLYGKNQYRVQYSHSGALDEWYQYYQNHWKVPNAPFVNIRYIEERYELENSLIQAVATGNETNALEVGGRFLALMVPQRVANMLRDRKDYTITLNTLLRKAAEQGGVHPIHIDSLSNNNIKQIEQLTSIEQCRSFQRKMIHLYCRLVKENSLQAYSLPIRKVITYIRTDLTADLSLKSMAEQLNVNASYLSSLFKKEIGVPLTEYVNACRISHAQALLLSTDQPIKTVALQCGISDMHYFSRMFKRMTSMTPKTYREKMRTENQEWLGPLPEIQIGKPSL